MSNLSNFGLMYSYSYWGHLEYENYFGDVYIVEYLTSDLRRRVQTYENNIMTIQTLENLQ
jgi:hypothetical protein